MFGCFFGHMWENTTRPLLTFNEQGQVVACESLTVKCKRCESFIPHHPTERS